MAVVDDAINRPFVWGDHDCSLFAARCADAVHGTKIEAKHAGRYKTARGAAGRVKRAGGMSGLLEAEGFTSKHQNFAQRGDLAIIDQDGREALGVVLGGQIGAAGVDGLVMIPISAAKEVWAK